MYEFQRDDAYRFARDQRIETRTRGDELEFKVCPYCRRTERDNLWKFSINLISGQHKCLRSGCGATGNMVTLAKDFGFELSGEEPKKTYRQLKTPKKPIEPKPAAIQYLEKRGISAEIAKKYEITTQLDHENILVFPFYDDHGQMRFVKYRKTDFDKNKDSNKEWCERDTMPILFGMKQCEDRTRLVLTEGQIDSLSVAQAGIKNAVSVPTGANGFTWVPNCREFVDSFDEIVVFGDHEHGKITLLNEVAERFGGKVKHVRESDYGDCKDANEILVKYGADKIRECIENAVYLPLSGVVDVADVVGINPHSVEKMRTGITLMDKLLKGGLPFGYFHIITGKRGEGKSTLASQILAEALDQGYGVFAYSGELPVGHFKAWIDYQIAGPRFIQDTVGDDGQPRWYIPKTDRKRIEDWYRGRFFAYDAEHVQKMDLLNTVELVVKRYGVRVVLIDNLMTAVDLDDNARANKYDAQGEFAKRLAEMARKYNILILLVAHKRKQQSADWFDSDPNDNIGGSSYVTNLCGDIIGYSRPTKNQLKEGFDPADRVLTVTKNRLFGNVEYTGWPMHFNEKSKRIGNELDDLYRTFSWDDVPNELPFDGGAE